MLLQTGEYFTIYILLISEFRKLYCAYRLMKFSHLTPNPSNNFLKVDFRIVIILVPYSYWPHHHIAQWLLL